MRKVLLITTILLLLVSLPSLFAEDIEDIIRKLEDNALQVHITARVKQKNNVSVWHMDISKVTISGKTVNVKLKGDDILVYANITPYAKSKNSILLVAQGQVWITSPNSKNVEYTSTIKSLPITTGEKVLFYPLGVATPTDNNHYLIELEIQVTPYSSDKSVEE